MVLIAAAVCTKPGKVLVSRQFVEMTRGRIEGLLAAFPKLVTAGKQHTFVETDSVRYVYQPMDKNYMLLVTTKASNILEDLETLRLFAKVVTEYCRGAEEYDIADNAFNIIFAFDEIVALGYRESVNLAQIRTYVEMDSHEEKVYQAVRQSQEREAKNKMREKAKELQRQKMEATKKGLRPTSGYNVSISGGFGNKNSYSSNLMQGDASKAFESKSKPYISSTKETAVPVKTMKLQSKSGNVEVFVDQLKSEGEVVTSLQKTTIVGPSIKGEPAVDTEEVHLRQEERMILSVGKNGGIENFELQGMITLHVSDEKWGRIYVQLENTDKSGLQLQTHPNVDKELFKAKSQIRLKNPGKPFPISTDVGVLKWRMHSQDESLIPLTISCWPMECGDGVCEMNVEYQLEHEHFEFNNVTVNIPLGGPGSVLTVVECDGEYDLTTRKNTLIWTLPVVNAENKTGSIEFTSTQSMPLTFFPMEVKFSSKTPYTKLKIADVFLIEDDSPVKFSTETCFYTSSYTIT